MTNTPDTVGNVLPVILCGGNGTRLWPVSRKSMPKQFIPMLSEDSLFQEIAAHVSSPDLFDAPVIVSNANFRHFIQRQLEEIFVEPQAILLEPESRNTAAAIALAALHEIENGRPDTCMLILPSDHYLPDHEPFEKSIKEARQAAMNGDVVTFGIYPTKPETGYGYIQCGKQKADGCFDVEKFTEKPDISTASAFLWAGKHLWNSGMFMFKARTIIDELSWLEPELVAHIADAYAKAVRSDGNVVEPNAESFTKVKSISIDYAVMEHTPHAVVYAAAFNWSDVGSWNAIGELGNKDEAGNVLKGNALLQDCKDTFIYSPDRLAVGVGLEDLIIVDTHDALLVMPKDRAQDVRQVVEELKTKKATEAEAHAKDHRPWGTFLSVDVGEQHQVKHITVYPGQTLSLQYHLHRAEHWVVVSGVADVTIGKKVERLVQNQSAFIPLGEVHRLHNPGSEPLHLIEVQFGNYLGEDDIVRVEDNYGRIKETKPPKLRLVK